MVGPATGLPPAGSTLAISGSDGVQVTLQFQDPVAGTFFQLVPQLPKPPDLTANPWNRSPFFTETWAQEHGMLIARVSDLSGSGTLYQVLLRAPADAAGTAKAVLHSMTLPPPATVTQAVHLLLTKPTPGAAPPLATTQAGGAGWLLAGGAPAGTQEPWFLFRTTDGGRRWTLLADTTWTASKTFPDTVGVPGLLFWNAHDGVIVQPADAGAFLIVYRSTDGGRSWRRSTIACPSPPVNTQPPHLARFADGRLILTAQLMDGMRFQVVSTDGGRTWNS
ncbi:MAG: glycoside hydrolase [Firmicutes bacterium]|nr:exo-alpha-sialidase [Alicyclobacillaceae bacterium]MCL6496147.1 glycoside hydrolase [Bacillota bacterium]